VLKLSKELSDLERTVYLFIKEQGELLTKNVPARMRGAIPNLKNKGLVEVIKKRTSLMGFKKRKFVKIKEDSN
jgi:hypothetical protein